MKVSVIVPMYHGQKYIEKIVYQVDQCAKTSRNIDVELILYNDCPEEKIEVTDYRYIFNVKCINAEKNLGIHGARIQGLMYSSGEYIFFLDQDDKISPQYIQSQVNSIGNADVVVCRLIHNGRLHYTDTFKFSEVVTKDFMLNKWNSIVSPGQVVIKKNSIPTIWMQNILKKNGADDYMLWLLMLLEERKFVLNDDVLFEHVMSGENFSEDTNKMMDSEIEMISILKSCAICEDYVWDNLKESLRRIHIKDLDMCKYSYNILKKIILNSRGNDKWIMIKEKNIAIYGAGEIGLLLGKLCNKNGMEIKYYIDKNANYIICDKPVYNLESIPLNKIEAIIVSLKDRDIKQEIQKKYKIPVYMIEDLVNR